MYVRYETILHWGDAVTLQVERRTSDWEAMGSTPARALLAQQL